MIKKYNVVLCLMVAALFIISGCGEDGDGKLTGNSEVVTETFTIDNISFSMSYLPGRLCFLTGIEENGVSVVTNAYWIAETEVSYEFWAKVYDWATDVARGENRYFFANVGGRGGYYNGSEYAVYDSGHETHPVTTVSWRDSMVWCNALTEYYNANNGSDPDYEVVYYSDSIYTIVIRDSRDGGGGASLNLTAGSFDKPYVKPTANGFRLPTLSEWSCAAQYAGSKSSNGTYKLNDLYWTPGTCASGATADYNNNTATGFVAVYSSTSTAIVKSKAPNTLGLYDMSGNVGEWNFDWGPDPDSFERGRAIRGGFWRGGADYVQIDYWVDAAPWYEDCLVGFRLARFVD